MYFAKDLTLCDQNWRTKSIVELSNSKVGTWIPSGLFILCFDFKFNPANNEKYLHSSERFTVTIKAVKAVNIFFEYADCSLACQIFWEIERKRASHLIKSSRLKSYIADRHEHNWGEEKCYVSERFESKNNVSKR